jgi:competence transcription factor ComK
MKLAERLAKELNENCEPVEAVKVSEGMNGHDSMNIMLKDGHRVNVHCSFDIFKNQYQDAGMVDDIEKQAMVREMLKPEMEKFCKAAAEKLKALSNLEG